MRTAHPALPSRTWTARLRRRSVLALVLACAGGAAIAGLGGQRAPSASAAPSGASIERGRYLTHDVAMCVQCHSPREESGRLLQGQEFRGAPMPLKSPYASAPFAFSTPNLRELARYSEDSMVRLLRTGIGRDGKPPQLPMPPFRMTQEDAESIVRYLRSLD